MLPRDWGRTGKDAWPGRAMGKDEEWGRGEPTDLLSAPSAAHPLLAPVLGRACVSADWKEEVVPLLELKPSKPANCPDFPA